MPNQYTNGKKLCRREQIFNFVFDNPQCNARNVADAIGMEISLVNMHLYRMQLQGRLHGDRVRGAKYIRWSVVDDNSGEAETPVQVVRQWWSGECKRDPLVAALFGPA